MRQSGSGNENITLGTAVLRSSPKIPTTHDWFSGGTSLSGDKPLRKTSQAVLMVGLWQQLSPFGDFGQESMNIPEENVLKDLECWEWETTCWYCCSSVSTHACSHLPWWDLSLPRDSNSRFVLLLQRQLLGFFTTATSCSFLSDQRTAFD